MFKVTIVVGIFLLLNFVKADDENKISLENAIQMLSDFLEDSDLKPTREQMVELITNKRDASPETMCLRFYMFDQFEMMQSDTTQMDPDKAVQLMLMVVPDKEAEFRVMVDTCNTRIKTANITDNCIAAHELSMCMLDQAKEREIEMPEIEEE